MRVNPRIPSFPSFLFPLALLVAPAGHAADGPLMDSTAQAAMAFARYTAALTQASPWGVETVQIDASLPRLEKRGSLRAIRRLLPHGEPEYQVLEITGDQTVRRQVIARYLSADVRAADIPAAIVAVTPANYKFHYKGSVKTGLTIAYGFVITPRRKGVGLLKGELWLDGETGIVVRQSGYLVKSPSIFVKRTEVRRETTLRGGSVEGRVTYLSVETRLVGRAELTIHENPGVDLSSGSAQSQVEQ